MFTLKRITTTPASPLRILVDAPDPESPDAGMTVGGSFYFEPAGNEGDTATVGDAAAGAIMGDASLAKHFECTPAWKPKGQATVERDAPAEKAGKGGGSDPKR